MNFENLVFIQYLYKLFIDDESLSLFMAPKTIKIYIQTLFGNNTPLDSNKPFVSNTSRNLLKFDDNKEKIGFFIKSKDVNENILLKYINDCYIAIKYKLKQGL